MKRERSGAVEEDDKDTKKTRLDDGGEGSSPAVKAEQQPLNGAAAEPALKQEPILPEDDDEEEYIVLPKSTSRAALKKGNECPYLDTVSRQVQQAPSCTQHAVPGTATPLYTPYESPACTAQPPLNLPPSTPTCVTC